MHATIGETLKAARTDKHLTLRQISKALHIKEIYLEAIEQDRLADLPSPVQAKGFIRLYWDHLELDRKELNQYWAPPPPPPAEVATTPPASPGEKPADPAVPQAQNAVQPLELLKSLTRRTQKAPAVATVSIQNVEPPPPAERLSDRSFQQIGRKLRKQREKMSLTINAIENYTHISQQYLYALEEGQIDLLPSPVQGRGMLSNYADFMDMNTDELLLLFAEGLQLRREENLAETQQPPRRLAMRMKKISLIGSFFSMDVILVGALILTSLVGLIWGASTIFSYQQRPRQTPTGIPISAILANTATEPILTGTVTTSETPQPEATLLVVEETLPLVTGSVTVVPVIPGGYPVQILVVDQKRAFVQVIVDGKIAFNGRMIPGNPYSFNGQNQIELITGNAGALQVIYNQTDMGTLGQTSEVIRIVFSANGFGTPTLTPTPTPTRTLQPTRTPRPSNTYPPTRTPVNTATPQP